MRLDGNDGLQETDNVWHVLAKCRYTGKRNYRARTDFERFRSTCLGIPGQIRVPLQRGNTSIKFYYPLHLFFLGENMISDSRIDRKIAKTVKSPIAQRFCNGFRASSGVSGRRAHFRDNRVECGL